MFVFTDICGFVWLVIFTFFFVGNQHTLAERNNNHKKTQTNQSKLTKNIQTVGTHIKSQQITQTQQS